MGVPKPTLKFDNSLEGLRAHYYAHSYGLLQQKDTDENQPREVAHGAEQGALDVLFQWG
jgi:hypothetical protein